MGSLALSGLSLAVFFIVLCRRKIFCFLVLTLELLELRKWPEIISPNTTLSNT